MHACLSCGTITITFKCDSIAENTQQLHHIVDPSITTSQDHATIMENDDT